MRGIQQWAVSYIVVAVGVLAVASSANSQPPERVRVLIGFKNAPGPSDEREIRGRGAEISRTFRIVPAMAITVPVTALNGIRRNPNVSVLEPDGSVTAVDAELDAAWGVKHIGSGSVHDSGVTGAGVKVAVIDTGVDCTHPDLDGNCVGGFDFVNDDNDPMDDNGHGTHVAGTIAAEDNGSGVVGVAPGASIYGLKVLGASGGGYWSDIVAAIEWAADNGIQVTNNSYGSNGHPGSIVEAAFNNAAARGVLHIAAAGNSGSCAGTENTVGYPARFASVVAVAATDVNDNRACFSSTGPTVEIAAPGVSINSTRVGGGYRLLSGTSMASPHAAGVAALVISSGVVDPNDVRQRLMDTANDLGSTGLDTHFGHGLVDPNEAVTVPIPNSAPLVTITKPADGLRFDAGTVLDFSATALDTEDGDLSSSVTWTSDVHGALGTGDRLSVGLSTGVHTIRASTTDSVGAVGSNTVMVTLTEPALPEQLRIASISYTPRDLGRRRNPLDVTVKVVDSNNQPVEGARVIFKIFNGRRTWKRRGRTGPDGTVTRTIRRSLPGCYRTEVRRVKYSGLTWDGINLGNQFCQ